MSWRAAVSTTALVLAILSAGAPAAAPVEVSLWWRMPVEPGVKWRGMLPTEGGAVGMGPQIGPYQVGGAGAAGLLAAILTHAAVTNIAQSSEYQQAQNASDRVLDPYAAALGAWSAADLWGAAFDVAPPSMGVRLWDGLSARGDGLVVETAPTFTMALDESVVILDVAVKLAAPDAPAVETSVRVISSPLGEINPRSYWSADEARQLKSTAAAMLAHALDMVSRYAIRSTDGLAPMRTHRYMFGSAERTERAQQLGGTCARLELRNLRGSLMSVPNKLDSEGRCVSTTSF